MHQHGFVVELKDGSNVLIGHCCAHNHLGLHDAEVKGALKQLSAAEKRNIRRHKVEMLLLQRDAFVERVRTANIRHRGLLERIDHLMQILPERVGDILQTRWKSSGLQDRIEQISPKFFMRLLPTIKNLKAMVHRPLVLEIPAHCNPLRYLAVPQGNRNGGHHGGYTAARSHPDFELPPTVYPCASQRCR